MPRNRTTSSNVEALDQVGTAVDGVLTLISAVLRKFPRNTVPDKLLPFMQAHADRAVRRATKGDEIVLVSTSLFFKTATLRFPTKLLDAPEQEITRWARDQYWSGINTAKFQAREQARANAEKARRAVEDAQRKLEKARQHLAAVSAPGKKKRQS